jgi:hypothetical protein
MTFKTHLFSLFKQRVLRPQLDRQDRWEQRVVAIPAATRGGANSPVRFNIPRAGIELAGDHPPLPGFPKSAPQMFGSIVNIRKSIFTAVRSASRFALSTSKGMTRSRPGFSAPGVQT